MITWIPFKTWHSWSPEERGQVTQYYESIGRQWAIDLADAPPENKLVGEFEEYQGETDDRGVDDRGFCPPDKMQLSRKT